MKDGVKRLGYVDNFKEIIQDVMIVEPVMIALPVHGFHFNRRQKQINNQTQN